MDGHPVHHQAFRRHAQRCGDRLVDRLEEEGIQRGWRLAAFGLEGEDGPELVVAHEEDPVGAEGQGSRRSRDDLVNRVHGGLLAALGGCWMISGGANLAWMIHATSINDNSQQA